MNLKSELTPDLFYEAFPPHTLLGSKFQNIKKVLASIKKRAKVLHTDLHSENILIDEETGTLYLIDFGIAITPSYYLIPSINMLICADKIESE